MQNLRTSAEAALALGVSRATISRWVSSGFMTGRRLANGSWLFESEEIDRIRLLRGREIELTPERVNR